MSHTFGSATHLIVIDVETTGLDVLDDLDDVVEVGAILTEVGVWEPIETYTRMILPRHQSLNRMWADEQVLAMHEASGLVHDIGRGLALRHDFGDPGKDFASGLAEVQDDLIGLLDLHGIEPGKVALAGSGIAAFDLPIIRKLMPDLASRATYYPADIGIVRRFAQTFGWPVSDANDAKTHRALDDAWCHLAEIRYFATLTAEETSCSTP